MVLMTAAAGAAIVCAGAFRTVRLFRNIRCDRHVDGVQKKIEIVLGGGKFGHDVLRIDLVVQFVQSALDHGDKFGIGVGLCGFGVVDFFLHLEFVDLALQFLVGAAYSARFAVAGEFGTLAQRFTELAAKSQYFVVCVHFITVPFGILRPQARDV